MKRLLRILISSLSVLCFLIPASALAAYTQEQKIVTADGGAGDSLGFAETPQLLSNDGTRMVIGSAYNNSSTGAAYIYLRSGNTWTLEREIFGPGAASRFGLGVSMSGDGSHVAVVEYPISGATDYVSVYSRTGTTWTLDQRFTSGDIQLDDGFGAFTAFSDDGSRLVISADRKTVSGHANQGAVYVYSRSGTTWTQEQEITAADGAAGDRLGVNGVSISSDGTRIALGNFQKTVTYVYSRSGTTWTLEQEISHPASKPTAMNFSLDSSRLVIGLCAANSFTGAAAVYSRSGTTWTLEQQFTGSDTVVGDAFGCSVAITDDGTRVVAGAYTSDDTGAVYVFTRSGTTWTQQQKILGSDTVSPDDFGIPIDITGDGSRIIAAASGAAVSGQLSQGAAYVFYDASLAATPTPVSAACHPEISSCLGRYATPTPTPTPSSEPLPSVSVTPAPSPSVSLSPTPLPSSPVLPSLFNLSEGDTIRATGDNDIFIINSSGYKRLFINPEIFNLYGHLGWDKVKTVSPSVRDSFITSGLFRNCETNDTKVYALSLDSPDSATLHWLNVSADSALSSDPSFFSKVFCINTREQNLYSQGLPYTSYSEIPKW